MLFLVCRWRNWISRPPIKTWNTTWQSIQCETMARAIPAKTAECNDWHVHFRKTIPDRARPFILMCELALSHLPAVLCIGIPLVSNRTPGSCLSSGGERRMLRGSWWAEVPPAPATQMQVADLAHSQPLHRNAGVLSSCHPPAILCSVPVSKHLTLTCPWFSTTESRVCLQPPLLFLARTLLTWSSPSTPHIH